jgi:hypothetical protein
MNQRLSSAFAPLCGIAVTLLASQPAAAASAPGQSQPAQTKAADPWQPIRGLLGSWEGDARGEPGSGKAEREYRLALRDKFVQVTNKSTYPPQEKNPKGEVHEDTGFISYDRAQKKLVLRQFHVEGFVNHYVLDSISPDGKKLVFVTVGIENIPPGWRGRETYEIVSDDEFVETFALAEPGKEFVTYSETRFRRKR